MRTVTWQNWNFLRILRLGLGIFVLVEGLRTADWLLGGLGLLFTLMPLLNIGCCATGKCALPHTNHNKLKEENKK